MNFLEHLAAETNKTTTENGAVAYRSTGHACLDWFALGAAKRSKLSDAITLFRRAMQEDPQTAVRILFYIRDIRGGQGERSIFLRCMSFLHAEYPTIYRQVIEHVPKYGRWKDLFDMGGICPEYKIEVLVKNQLAEDRKSKSPSLMAKWMPTDNCSNKRRKAMAKTWAHLLHKSPRDYRLMVSNLRRKIQLVEQNISSNEWGDIDYSKIPGGAFKKYSKAFARHDHERFDTFINRAKEAPVKEGKKVINTSTLYTYEVFDKVAQGELDVADALWANLPDYEVQDALVMADVSGSMCGRPMSISVSLALYFAERAKGQFHNKFMTFTAEPQLVEVQGNTLQAKLSNIESSRWESNTDFNKAMDAIFEAAKQSEPEEVPKVLYVISDMEFDAAQSSWRGWGGHSVTPYQANKAKWDAAGIPMPTIVFWNVNSHQNQVPTVNDQNVVLLSGASTSTFKLAMSGKSPMEVMRDVVDSERYAPIVLV